MISSEYFSNVEIKSSLSYFFFNRNLSEFCNDEDELEMNGLVLLIFSEVYNLPFRMITYVD